MQCRQIDKKTDQVTNEGRTRDRQRKNVWMDHRNEIVHEGTMGSGDQPTSAAEKFRWILSMSEAMMRRLSGVNLSFFFAYFLTKWL